jgi:hypothetical protein
MKAKIFFFAIFLTCAFGCGGPREISGNPVSDNDTVTPTPVCNHDGHCNADETQQNCASDCTLPVCNNDGHCDAGETTDNCPNDCQPTQVCDHDGTCDAGETQQNCASDCTPAPICDNDGTCDSGETLANCPADCTPPSHKTGTLSYSGLNYFFDFTSQQVHLQNTNPYVVRLSGNFYNNLILEPSQGNTIQTGFSLQQQIEIRVWKGEAATWYGVLHGYDPDLVGRVVLGEGAMSATTDYNELASYVALISPTADLKCEFSGRYNKSDITKQQNQTFHCYNAGSTYAKMELFHIVPSGTSRYKTDAKLGTIISIAPQREEIIKLDYVFPSADMLAIRVTAASTSITTLMLEITTEKASAISGLTVEIIE